VFLIAVCSFWVNPSCRQPFQYELAGVVLPAANPEMVAMGLPPMSSAGIAVNNALVAVSGNGNSAWLNPSGIWPQGNGPDLTCWPCFALGCFHFDGSVEHGDDAPGQLGDWDVKHGLGAPAVRPNATIPAKGIPPELEATSAIAALDLNGSKLINPGVGNGGAAASLGHHHQQSGVWGSKVWPWGNA
jgi:hypothetical protein